MFPSNPSPPVPEDGSHRPPPLEHNWGVNLPDAAGSPITGNFDAFNSQWHEFRDNCASHNQGFEKPDRRDCGSVFITVTGDTHCMSIISKTEMAEALF
ncbi:hypothetical protein F3Y22_tig00116958pilonHSYRG00211 [Hibiscus syriacus]|uniref:Uncharacterized protein n=1 Tax=Hibiscus syriacus TaxID=106335 RepID=A0A6A2XDH0_HIBSY|nr:hypothetical protein F3Y22_tig00116958pilonHSYRG00211 [Hibiscus syriacus]